jgi:hypothetical protein
MTLPTVLRPTETVYYLYGLAEEIPNLTGSGMSEAPFEILARLDGIIALGSSVSRERFGPEEVELGFKDVNWVSQVATEHYAACENIFRQAQGATFLPFRLCTVFSDPALVESLLVEHRAAFKAEFDRLRGKAEFGLKLWVTKEWLNAKVLAMDVRLRQAQAEVEQGGGKAFFARKRFEADLEESKKRLLPEIGRRLAALINQELKLNPGELLTFSPNPPTANQINLLNMALLMSTTQENALVLLANRLDREVLKDGTVEQLGPLPPFSFITLGG